MRSQDIPALHPMMNRSRWFYILVGSTLFLLGTVGYLYQVPTLAISLCIALACLALGVFSRRQFSVLLIDIWITAYIYLFLSEYLELRDEVMWLFGTTITSESEGFIVAAFGASLVGYALSVRFFVCRWVSAQEGQPVLGPKHQGIPSGVLLFMFFPLLVILYYTFVLVTPEQLLLVARSQRADILMSGPLPSFMRAAVTMFPITAAYLLSKYKTTLFHKTWMLMASCLAVLVAYLSGMRFMLGFVAVGLLFFLLQGFHKLNRKHVAVLLLAGVALMAAQTTVRYSRMAGIGNMDLPQMLQEIGGESLLSSEGLLQFNAWIHLTHYYEHSDRPIENLFILYWWVPRTLWPAKPTMAGYWFIREMEGESRFPSTHSGSGGFSMPALLDFGPIGGAFFSLLYGVFIAVLEAYVQRYRNPQHPGSVLASILYFGVFFMMRSYYTALIFMITASLTFVVPLALLERPTMRKQPEAFVSVSEQRYSTRRSVRGG